MNYGTLGRSLISVVKIAKVNQNNFCAKCSTSDRQVDALKAGKRARFKRPTDQ